MRKLFIISVQMILLGFAATYSFGQESQQDVQKLYQDPLIAKGDGFEIRQSYVNRFQEFIEQGNEKTTQAEYRKGALQLKLFALEAERMNLDTSLLEKELGEKEDEISEDESFEQEVKLRYLYFKNILDTYVLDDLIIESYYYAHPNMFADENYESGYIPLDMGVQEDIRGRIVGKMYRKILQKEMEELKKKYHVEIVGENK